MVVGFTFFEGVYEVFVFFIVELLSGWIVLKYDGLNSVSSSRIVFLRISRRLVSVFWTVSCFFCLELPRSFVLKRYEFSWLLI